MKISPSQKDIDYWVETFLPARDIYYLDDLSGLELPAEGLLLSPRQLLDHPEYGGSAYFSTYEYARLDPNLVNWVLVASPDWFAALPMLDRAKLFRAQVRLARGLVFDQQVLPGHAFIKMIQHAGVDGKLVLNHFLWNRLDLNLRQQTVERVARFFDGFECESCPEDAPAWVKTHANSFIRSDSANSFGVALFAISGKSEWLEKGVKPQEFKTNLVKLGYQPTDRDEALAGDVTIFFDESGLEKHACYHLGSGLVLNKHGQSKYQALKVTPFTQVLEGWQSHTSKLFALIPG